MTLLRIRRYLLAAFAVAATAAIAAGCGTNQATAPPGNSPAAPKFVQSTPPAGASKMMPLSGGVLGAWSGIVSKFDATQIPAGRYIWFNSIIVVKNVGTTPATLSFDGGSVSLPVNGQSVSLSVPNAEITFSPLAVAVTTTFDPARNTWVTTAPSSFAGKNLFLAGFVLPVSSTLPGNLDPVVMRGRFTSDLSGMQVTWKWAAAVYTQVPPYADMGVKPCDGDKMNPYKNSDHAASPEACKAYVAPGARGGGGSNYTGGLSGSSSFVISETAPSAGTTQTVSAAGGGSVTAGAITVIIPPGALSSDTPITVSPDPNGLLLCDLGPDGLQFLQPYTLQFNYAGSSADPLSPNYVPGTLQCLWYDPSTAQWVAIPGDDDPAHKIYSGYSSHFSRYALAQ